MTDAELQAIELRALRAAEVDGLKIDGAFSCGEPIGHTEPYRGGISYVQTGWRTVTYSYQIKAKGRVLPVHDGLITVKPTEKPVPPDDAVFFAHAREDVLKLVAALKEATVTA